MLNMDPFIRFGFAGGFLFSLTFLLYMLFPRQILFPTVQWLPCRGDSLVWSTFCPTRRCPHTYLQTVSASYSTDRFDQTTQIYSEQMNMYGDLNTCTGPLKPEGTR